MSEKPQNINANLVLAFVIAMFISLIYLSFSRASAAEHIDYIDTAQVKAYGEMTTTQAPSIRNYELSESTSTGNIVFTSFNAFIELTDKLCDEMYKDWQTIVSYAEGEIR